EFSSPLADYVVDCVSETVDYAFGRPHLSPAVSRATRGRAILSARLAKFTRFVSTVLARADVRPPVLLVALVYISRLRPHLCMDEEEWALERVFLGALICASKYTDDSALKNVHWAVCTGVFGKYDIGRIEREFLAVLDWELGVTESDLLAHHGGLMAAVSASPPALAGASTCRQLPIPRPRRQTHQARCGVPALEPSSPQSSLGSASPRTPRSPALSYHTAPDMTAPTHKPQMMDLPIDVDADDAHPAPIAVLACRDDDYDALARMFAPR
ncbi:hypothetical protein B0H19DRAFT_970096, partial [Mycena capillaripes]